MKVAKGTRRDTMVSKLKWNTLSRTGITDDTARQCLCCCESCSVVSGARADQALGVVVLQM